MVAERWIDPKVLQKIKTAGVADLVGDLTKRFQGLRLDLYMSGKDDGGNPMVDLSAIVVPKGQRESGVGTAVMKEIVREADTQGWTVTLTPSSDFGGSKSRLESFYRQFGFVPNKGRNKDFTTRATMLRKPRTKMADYVASAWLKRTR